jgi:hypothetical protein
MRLLRAALIAPPAAPRLLGNRGSPVVAALALLILPRHLPALILVPAANVLTALCVGRRCTQEQRRRRRKYLCAFHTPPYPRNFYTPQYTPPRPACPVGEGTFTGT